MSETSLLDPISSTDPTPDRAVVFGMALCSFAALLLELALTRLFSVVLFYHFAFLAISIALLGLGAGGVFAHLRKDRLARFGTRALVARLCSINALIVPVVFQSQCHRRQRPLCVSCAAFPRWLGCSRACWCLSRAWCSARWGWH